MKTVMVFSETGGATKTTTAVSLARLAAGRGIKTLLVDLDPRGATTKWTRVEPSEPWRTSSAIIAEAEPDGWAEDLALQSDWHPNLWVLPSSRDLANRERDTADYIELRLVRALEGCTSDLVILDCPNRQGGPLAQNALAASDGVIYAAPPDQDGTDGVSGARESVARFVDSRHRIGGEAKLKEIGIVVGRVPDTIMTKVSKAALSDLDSTGLLLHPPVPKRTVVEQARMSGVWYGDFEKGEPVVVAYEELLDQVLQVLEISSV